MRDETANLLNELRSFRWFENVGRDGTANVISVHSWKQAISGCSKRKWESLQLQVGNRLSYLVNTTAYDRFMEWNPITIEINQHIDRLIADPVRQLATKHGLPERFKNCVALDLTLSCQELEFSDVVEPVYFLKNILPWYQAGHFPCGWVGKELKAGWEGPPMPDGKLIVY